MHKRRSSRMKTGSAFRGFTLIELLVVVAIIALLISILLPSLKNAREQARTAVCLTRQKGLGLAMHEFTAEHQGYYPDADLWFHSYGAPGMPLRFGYDPRSRQPNAYDPPEAGGFYDAPYGPNHRGYFAKYMGRNIDAFMCPSDNGFRQYKGFMPQIEFMALPPRLSYVMNGDLWFLNGVEQKEIQGAKVWYTDKVLLQSPAKVMLLMEESPYGPINDPWGQFRGYLYPSADNPDSRYERGWGGRLAERHNKRGTILLFDGHAEVLLAREKWNGSKEWEKTNPQANRDANRNAGMLFDSVYAVRNPGGLMMYYVRENVSKNPNGPPPRDKWFR